jgi:hypothetical protein
MVVPGTLSGHPAVSTARRTTLEMELASAALHHLCEPAGSSSEPRQAPTARPGCRLRIARIM